MPLPGEAGPTASGAADQPVGGRARRDPVRVLALIETIGLGGGAERLLVSLGEELRRQGVDVEVAALRRAPLELVDDFRAAGIPVHRGPDITGRASMPLAMSWAARLLRRGRFDVAWGHMFHGNVCGALAASSNPRVRSVMTLHATAASYTTLGFRAQVALKSFVGQRFATAKVAVSNAVAREYGTFLHWDDIQVIHNGIPARSWEPTNPTERGELRALLGIGAERSLIVVPARLADAKGHDTALDALVLLKKGGANPLMIFAGQGPRAEVLEQAARDMGVSDAVRFLGAIPQQELFKWVRAADCVALPSYEEPFGLAGAEAMALGVPSVLTRVGGFVEIVGTSEGALLVPPRDPLAFAEAIGRVLREPELRRRLAVDGRKRVVDAFDVSVSAGKWVDLLNGVATNPSRSPLARFARAKSR